MIRVLGRQTSGNVQKVLFLLEELGLKYTREDYGRQFNNTNTDAYRKLNPNMKVPTVIDGDVVIWESHTVLRYLATLHQPALLGAAPAERTYVERWMDWLLASLNTPYVAVFKDAKKPPAERGADFSAQSADLVAQLKILDGHLAAKSWFALDRLTLADIALGRSWRAASISQSSGPPSPISLAGWLSSSRGRPSQSPPAPSRAL